MWGKEKLNSFSNDFAATAVNKNKVKATYKLPEIDEHTQGGAKSTSNTIGVLNNLENKMKWNERTEMNLIFTKKLNINWKQDLPS